ncbi:MAG TPA: hypothetical protein DEG32_05710, partial [Balneolaceae bacterium]|nr:hypothetical protein [Balneolaceae bacterium]
MKSLETVFGPNSALVEELYDQYQQDPGSVPAHWKRYFDELEGKPVDATEPDELQPSEQKTSAQPSNGSESTAQKQPETKKEPKKE